MWLIWISLSTLNIVMGKLTLRVELYIFLDLLYHWEIPTRVISLCGAVGQWLPIIIGLFSLNDYWLLLNDIIFVSLLMKNWVLDVDFPVTNVNYRNLAGSREHRIISGFQSK